jgi:hypothetical protein
MKARHGRIVPSRGRAAMHQSHLWRQRRGDECFQLLTIVGAVLLALPRLADNRFQHESAQ